MSLMYTYWIWILWGVYAAMGAAFIFGVMALRRIANSLEQLVRVLQAERKSL